MRTKSWRIKSFGKVYELGALVVINIDWLSELMELFVEEVSAVLYEELKHASPGTVRKLYNSIKGEVKQRVADEIVKELLQEVQVGGKPADFLKLNIKGGQSFFDIRDGESLLLVFDQIFSSHKYDLMIVETLKIEYGLKFD